MPELRRDPVVDRWVIIAPERADRPNALVRDFQLPDDEEGCPFCPGNEFLTPPEIAALRDHDRWTLRVVPNRYPALRTEERLSRKAVGLYDLLAGVGAHEVIIETEIHGQPLHELPLQRISSVLRAVQDRMLDLSRDVRLRSIVFFKNSGAIAGGSLSHPHSQLLALPVVPVELQRELDGARRHFENKERCVYCDVLDQEMGDRSRLVLETDLCVVLAPWAARTPFELLVLPREHRSAFEKSTGEELVALASALRTALRKLDLALDRPAYNLYLHTQPLREPESRSFHFHLEIKPVLTLQGGFEWSTGYSVNPTPPEEAAAFLRQTEA
jgi:UDPglucose--hexose-1-phosphate uridylyltransferase